MVLRTYACTSDNYPWCEWPAGRVLLMPLALAPGHEDEIGMQRKLVSSIVDCLGEKDILALSLFRNKARQPYGQSWLEPLPDFDDVLALIREVGPGLRGVMIGQQGGVELSYRYLYHAWNGDAVGNICACSDFVKKVGGMLRNMGVTPFFAPMDWDILQDAYLCDGRMLKALHEVGATAWVACGYTLVSGAFVKEGDFECPRGEHLRAQSQWAGRGWRDPEPDEDFPVLRDYLQAGPFWSGLCGIDGIRGRNIETLGAYGFSGFATKLQEPWLPELAAERGPFWWS